MVGWLCFYLSVVEVVYCGNEVVLVDLERHLCTDPREVVIRRLCVELGRWPDVRFGPLETDGLSGRDGRLAHAIYSETMRRLVTLEYLLNTALRRPLCEIELKLRACLLAGACQIFFFDHLPDHAVVDESVEWAGRFVRVKAKGLVNAILRKMIALRGEYVEAEGTGGGWKARLDDAAGLIPLSDGRWLCLGEDVLPSDLAERLSVQTSHPVELVSRWLKRVKRQELKRMLLHNLTPAPTIVTGEWGVGWEEKLGDHEEAGFKIWEGGHDGLVDFLDKNQDARVQDPGSAALCSGTSCLDLAGKVIVDYCAGSGTKTAQLAAMHPESEILATDVSDRRRGLLEARFADHKRVRVIEPDELADHAGRAGLLVLDVPCSNTGVLARRIEAKYRVDVQHLGSLTDIQKQIVADSLICLQGDGHILYSTCSIEPIENERQGAWMVKWHKKAVISEECRLPSGLPHENSSRYRDGGYHVLLGCL